MKFGSVCSGIEAASVAFEPLGFTAQWFSEIEHFPSEVLKHRFPTVPNLGDMTKLINNDTFRESTIDLLVGGTPCQSFSVAGLRGGLADPRGNLMLTFLGLADAKKPRWIVWENVPGVLSSNGGKDFATFLGALGELGYGFAYRVLDAQYFGVAQRRRRVFVVGYLGDWRPAAAVLFERESLSRDSKPSRKKGKETPTDAQGGVGEAGFAGNVESQVAACLQTTCDDYSRADGFNTVIEQVAQPIMLDDQGGSVMRVIEDGVCGTLRKETHGHEPLIAQPVHAFKVRGGCEGGGKGYLGQDESAFTISTNQDQHIAQPIPIHDQATRFQGKRGDKQDGKGNGLGIGNEGDVMNTLTKADKHAVAQPIAYSFDSLASNSMKSSNPDSGCREVETSKTIDTTTPEPSKNQGGIAIAQPIAVDWRTAQVDVEMTGTLKTDLAKMSGPCIAVDCYNQTINENTSQTIGSSRSDVNHYGAVLEQKNVGALCARDYKGVGSQYVDEGKVIPSPVTMAIRRLTPKECERLQGFPDDWTKIPYRNKPADQCPDGPRYKACGNSMAVPVMHWIGKRIQLIDTIIN